MFWRRSEATAEGHGETVISRETNLQGTIKSDGMMRIFGTFEGQIETAGTLIIGEHAQVVADIVAQNVAVAGMLKGNIHASGRIEILAGGRVYGDIVTSSLRIEEGAFFTGLSQMEGHQMGIAPLGMPERQKEG